MPFFSAQPKQGLDSLFLANLADALNPPGESEIAGLVAEVLRIFTDDEVEALIGAIALDLAFGLDAEFTPEQQAASDKLQALIEARQAGLLRDEDDEVNLWPVEDDESEDVLWFEEEH